MHAESQEKVNATTEDQISDVVCMIKSK